MQSKPEHRRALTIVLAWIVAMAVALSLDAKIARAVHTSGLGHAVEGKGWAQVIKEPGEIRFTVVIAALLLLSRQIRPKQAVFILLAGILSGTNGVVKWMAGRFRPYKMPGTSELQPFHLRPFWHGIPGLFNQHDLCFPSGHECAAGALAVAIFFVWPKGRWISAALAVMVGIERVAENAHYTSDVVAAIGFAVLVTTSLHHVVARWMKPPQPRGFEVVFDTPVKVSSQITS